MKEGAEENPAGRWYVFNDFVVSEIQPEEAVSFFPDWKLPCVLVYSVDQSPARPSSGGSSPITSDVFKEDKSLAQKSEGLQRISFLPLVRILAVSNDII